MKYLQDYEKHLTSKFHIQYIVLMSLVGPFNNWDIKNLQSHNGHRLILVSICYITLENACQVWNVVFGHLDPSELQTFFFINKDDLPATNIIMSGVEVFVL